MDRRPAIATWALAGVILPLVVLVLFLLAPGEVASKTHAALHGLCAQRPSHSLHIGGQALPVDARMTGIYLGGATTICWLLLSGRSRAAKTPPTRVIVPLAVFVMVLAADGLNALFVDLGAPHPYEPSNALRFATGTLGGITLGVALTHLFAGAVWTAANPNRAVVDRAIELAPPGAIVASLGLLAATGLPILYAPLAVGLLLAAILVLWTLNVVMLAFVTGRGWSYRAPGELVPLGLAALAVAIALIAALAGLRWLTESILGLPKFT
jgi:uncharacterized membrane protein